MGADAIQHRNANMVEWSAQLEAAVALASPSEKLAIQSEVEKTKDESEQAVQTKTPRSVQTRSEEGLRDGVSSQSSRLKSVETSRGKSPPCNQDPNICANVRAAAMQERRGRGRAGRGRGRGGRAEISCSGTRGGPASETIPRAPHVDAIADSPMDDGEPSNFLVPGEASRLPLQRGALLKRRRGEIRPSVCSTGAVAPACEGAASAMQGGAQGIRNGNGALDQAMDVAISDDEHG